MQPNPAWSLMRCVFAFEICLIHVCTSAWREIQPGWAAETLFISITRTGTIGFMMLTGAILIGRGPGNVGDYLYHRFSRWLPGLIAAQAIYIGYSLWYGLGSIEKLTWLKALEPAWYHVWFFYALVTIYVAVVPMRRYAAWAGSLPQAHGRVALWGPVAVFLAALGWGTLVAGGFWGDLRPVNLLVYCGYVWTGHVLAVSFPRGTAAGWWLLAAGVATATLATVWATENAGVPIPHFFHRCTIFIAIAAIGQFMVLLQARDVAWEASQVERLNRLSRLTLGVFVVHPLIIALAGWPHPWALVASAEWITLPLAALVLFGISSLVTWIAFSVMDALRKIGQSLGSATRAH
jgi:surface polysaccharide O-acyltransferase-like enzyme